MIVSPNHYLKKILVVHPLFGFHQLKQTEISKQVLLCVTVLFTESAFWAIGSTIRHVRMYRKSKTISSTGQQKIMVKVLIANFPQPLN